MLTRVSGHPEKRKFLARPSSLHVPPYPHLVFSAFDAGYACFRPLLEKKFGASPCPCPTLPLSPSYLAAR